MESSPRVRYPVTRRRKAYEDVAEAIRTQVLGGELKEGERLPPERDMAEGFQVSRVVIREAIRTLEMAGILKVRKGSGGGTYVSRDYAKPLSTALKNLLRGGSISLDHLFEIRLLLEPPAAALATMRAKQRDLESLARLVAKAEEAQDDALALRDHNLEFHRRLVGMAGNPLLNALCKTVLDLLVSSMQDHLNLAVSKSVLGFHKFVLEAVKARRPEQVRRLVEEDLGILHAKYVNIKKRPESGVSRQTARTGSQ